MIKKTLILIVFFNLSVFSQTRDIYGKIETPIRMEFQKTSVFDTNFFYIGKMNMYGYIPHAGQLSKDGLEYYVGLDFNTTDELFIQKRTSPQEPFGVPIKLSKAISDSFNFAGMPTVTKDTKSIIFSANDNNVWENTNLYEATREDTSLEFSAIRSLDEINSPDSADNYPWISPDGLRIYFSRAERVYYSFRESMDSLFKKPRLLDTTIGFSFSPWLFDDELTMYYIGSGLSCYSAQRSSIDSSFRDIQVHNDIRRSPWTAGFSMYDSVAYIYQIGPERIEMYRYKPTITNTENERQKLNSYYLNQNYPNPFNPVTTISFTIPVESHTKLNVYNMLGEIVSTLVDEKLVAGNYSYDFNVINLPSGVYLYELRTEKYSQAKKMLLIK